MAQPSENVPDRVTPEEKTSTCLLCGQTGPVLLYGHWICDRCKNVVEAEALSKKREAIREGGGPASAD